MNDIFGNSISANDGLGIDLANDGLTPNDTKDPDSGPNELQNYPVITSVAVAPSSTTTVSGTLNSMANLPYRIDFYGGTACDLSGSGEGQLLIGTTNVTTDSQGNAGFGVVVDPLTPGEVATGTASGPEVVPYTSEFSACVVATT